MKFLILIAIGVVGVVQSDVFITPVAENSEYPGQCYYDKSDTPVNVGDRIDMKGQCGQLLCRQDYKFYGYTCDNLTNVPKKCKLIEEDLSKPYPECCPKMDCPHHHHTGN